MRQQRGFIVGFIGLFSLLLVASVIGFSLVKVTSKAQAKTTAATFSLTGDVKGDCFGCKPPGPPPIPGVTITFTRVSGSGVVPLPVQTGSDGKFNQAGFEEGTTYRVTPSGLDRNYSPAYRDFSAANDRIFFSVAPASYTLSGHVTFNGVGLDGVRVSITRDASPPSPPLYYMGQTDVNGNWSVSGIRAGIIFYTIYATKPGYVFTPCYQTSPGAFPVNFEASLPTFVPVSSADFRYRDGYCGYPSVAHESIASIFGSNLAITTQIATSQPLPTELAGTRIRIKYDDGVERDAPLFFVSPSQINFQVPTITNFNFSPVAGYYRTVSIQVVRNGTVVNQGNVSITDFQPTIFTADSSGKGLPAAVAYRLKANGAESYEPVGRFDPAQGRFVTVPIEFGDETEQLFLVLFGTGGKTSLASYEVTIGGTPAQVTYVGLQPSFVGVIQTNILLPRTLIGRGDAEVRLRAIGREANPVTVNIR